MSRASVFGFPKSVLCPKRPGRIGSSSGQSSAYNFKVHRQARNCTTVHQTRVDALFDKPCTIPRKHADAGVMWIDNPVLPDAVPLIVVAFGDQVLGFGPARENLDRQIGSDSAGVVIRLESPFSEHHDVWAVHQPRCQHDIDLVENLRRACRGAREQLLQHQFRDPLMSKSGSWRQDDYSVHKFKALVGLAQRQKLRRGQSQTNAAQVLRISRYGGHDRVYHRNSTRAQPRLPFAASRLRVQSDPGARTNAPETPAARAHLPEF